MGIVSYKLKTGAKKSSFVMVEVDELDEVPRQAGLRSVADAARDFKTALEPISAVANELFHILKSAKPGEVAVEFGIELGSAAGIPLITKHEGKANFKVTLKWKSAGSRNTKQEDEGDE